MKSSSTNKWSIVRVGDVILVVILLTLIVFRAIGQFEKVPTLIATVNFAGIPIALLTIYAALSPVVKRFRGVVMFVALITVILTILVFIGTIELDERCNDIVTLVILLISLPQWGRYERLFGGIS